MIKFCVKELKYSEGAAYRRIQAARLLREIPEILPLIGSGQLTLSNTAKASEFFKAEKIKDTNNKKDIVQEILGKSTREAEQSLKEKSAPDSSFRRKNILRQTTASDFELTVTISDSIKNKLHEIKNIKSHSLKNYEDVLSFALDIALTHLKKETTPRKLQANNRCATAAMKTKLLKNAKYQCQYKGCTGRAFLQADHIRPFSLGGETSLSNMRILCQAHNARRVY